MVNGHSVITSSAAHAGQTHPNLAPGLVDNQETQSRLRKGPTRAPVYPPTLRSWGQGVPAVGPVSAVRMHQKHHLVCGEQVGRWGHTGPSLGPRDLHCSLVVQKATLDVPMTLMAGQLAQVEVQLA